MNEKRNALRPRTFLKAEAEISGRSMLPCTVRDLSDLGAKLTISEAVPLPERFRLRIARQPGSIPVQVRWRQGDSVGVEFKPGSADVTLDALRDEHVRLLEAEVARLRRILDELRLDPSKIHALLDADAA